MMLLTFASERLRMPTPSWWPILQEFSIPHCLSGLIARFPGFDNPQWAKDSSSHV